MGTPLENLGADIVGSLVASAHRYGRVASGKTVNEIEYVVEGVNRVYVVGPAHLIQLEKGRGRTNPTGPYQRYGGLSFKDSLALWMDARGIDQGKKGKNQTYGPVLWAIYTTINEKGYAGTPGLLSKPLSDQAISAALDKNLGPLANLYASQVLKEIFK